MVLLLIKQLLIGQFGITKRRVTQELNNLIFLKVCIKKYAVIFDL